VAKSSFDSLFTPELLKRLFPKDRADQFFDALYGDRTDGAYDISLEFKGHNQNELQFELHLKQRPGKCLACNLTFGLPRIFSSHPIININGLVNEIDHLLNGQARCANWQLGSTHVVYNDLHVIPLILFLDI
jgi:hypothetical protein